ncbi:uncharacterized protein LOC113375996, partial [Ctenocephalides felis]|uniref:uncharacterized protein LOC113375996 n=1 Tax=Ctenocephalides felis TaxID=7515 RepID=UPI000E6E3F0E
MSGRKGSTSGNVHPGRSKKRKFSGNRFTHQNDTVFTSASAKKLKNNMNMEVPIASNFAYCILEFVSVFAAISEIVICKTCKSDVSISRSSFRGLGFKIILSCECEKQTVINSGPLIGNAFEVNRRFVFAMRLLGAGQEGVNLFCSFMDMCSGVANSTYTALLENIHMATSSLCDTLLAFAVTQEKTMNEESGKPQDELTVSGDSTWKKRGFSSLLGVSTLIGKYTGKVLDVMIMSSFCGGCNLWKNRKKTNLLEYEMWYEMHVDECTINHSRSSGQMEISAITKMFLRSVEKYGVKYLTYIGDGDSKTFKGMLDTKPYGDTAVTKKQCVSHVEKRMGTRLRAVKKDKTNKGIGGKGAGELTDKVIQEITKFYGLAIRRHPDLLEDMRKEVWATYYHKCSSDQNPQHQFCPEGEDSWCKWRKAEANNELDQFHHDKSPLIPQVQEAIKPVFEDLSKDELLIRCLGAETQNNNESLNSLIWTFAPKHLHSGPKIVEIASYLAIIIFNEGFQGILKVMSIMGCPVGREAQAYVEKRDEKRILRSERRVSDVVKQA